MFRTNTRCQIITNNLVCGISQQSVGQNRLILCDSSQCWRRIGEAMSSSACCSGEGNERVWLFARDIKRHFISVDKTSATLSFKTDRVQIHDQKSLTKKKKRYVVIAGCFRNIYDVLKKLLRAPWLPMRNVDTHSSCWRSRRWLWPSRWKTPSSETNCRMCQLSQNNMGMEIKKNGQSTSIANEQPCVVNEKKL